MLFLVTVAYVPVGTWSCQVATSSKGRWAVGLRIVLSGFVLIIGGWYSTGRLDPGRSWAGTTRPSGTPIPGDYLCVTYLLALASVGCCTNGGGFCLCREGTVINSGQLDRQTILKRLDLIGPKLIYRTTAVLKTLTGNSQGHYVADQSILHALPSCWPASPSASGGVRARPGHPGGPGPHPPTLSYPGNDRVIPRELPGIVNRGAARRRFNLGRRHPLGLPVANGPPGPTLPAALLGHIALRDGSQRGCRPDTHRTFWRRMVAGGRRPGLGTGVQCQASARSSAKPREAGNCNNPWNV